MTLENLRKPRNPVDASLLWKDLSDEFKAQQMQIKPDHDFGGLGTDLFGFYVDDESAGVNLGFMQILFEPAGWTVVVPQNELGKRSLRALARALGRPPEKMELTPYEITYAMYLTHFPYKNDASQE